MKLATASRKLLGNSEAMRNVYRLISKSALAKSNVLITGESGTGKELVAREIHSQSLRADKPFIAVNCAAIPENLLESELFGHVQGAFTDASEEKKGLLEEAQGGTLFLDEIGDLSLSLQAKILRVIQEKEVRPVGGKETKKLDVRFIFATHRDLQERVLDGEFREDLYYRINVIPIELPPLRMRSEDIPLLVESFLFKFCTKEHCPLKTLTANALAVLKNYKWPGNIRQLENMMERMVILNDSRIIESDMIHFDDEYDDNCEECEDLFSDEPSLEVLRARYIEYVLKKVGDNKTKASEILGISRRSLYRREEEEKDDKDTLPLKIQ